jgi:hypothetical protein
MGDMIVVARSKSNEATSKAGLVQEYLGHTNVQNTARYMDGVSARFRGIWD